MRRFLYGLERTVTKAGMAVVERTSLRRCRRSSLALRQRQNSFRHRGQRTNDDEVGVKSV